MTILYHTELIIRYHYCTLVVYQSIMIAILKSWTQPQYSGKTAPHYCIRSRVYACLKLFSSCVAIIYIFYTLIRLYIASIVYRLHLYTMLGKLVNDSTILCSIDNKVSLLHVGDASVYHDSNDTKILNTATVLWEDGTTSTAYDLVFMHAWSFF